MFNLKIITALKNLNHRLLKFFKASPLWLKILSVALLALLVSGCILYKYLANTVDPFWLGQYYFNADNRPDGEYNLVLARKYYTEAIEKGSDNPLVWYQLGRIDFLEGNYSAALYKFEKQISLYGDRVPNVYYMKGLTLGYKARKSDELGDWQKAEESFLKYIEYDPESPWARTDLSWVYFSQGKFEEMIPLVEKGLEFEPSNPWLLNMYGLALMNIGQNEAAREQFTKAREYASYLTADDWGKTYPGNDPAAWVQGIEEFKSLIEKNFELVSTN